MILKKFGRLMQSGTRSFHSLVYVAYNFAFFKCSEHTSLSYASIAVTVLSLSILTTSSLPTDKWPRTIHTMTTVAFVSYSMARKKHSDRSGGSM
jgi:hypothetical protein